MAGVQAGVLGIQNSLAGGWAWVGGGLGLGTWNLDLKFLLYFIQCLNI